MFSKKIKIPDELWGALEQVAQTLGCSVEDFALRAIQREVEKVQTGGGTSEASKAEVDAITAKMKGLGYIE